MKLLQKLLILTVASFVPALMAEPIVVTDASTGLFVESIPETKPDKAGMVLTREVTLPPFERGAYYRPYSGGGARGNRVEAVAFDSIADLEAYKRLTDILIANDDRELAESETLIFNEQVDRIAFMNRGNLLEELADPGVEQQEDPDLRDSVQAIDSATSDATRVEGADSFPLAEDE